MTRTILIRILPALVGLVIGPPSMSAPAAYRERLIDAWRLEPRLIPNRIVREAGPRAAHLALAIAHRESRFNPLAIGGPNHNKTYDFGLFGLNSVMIRKLHITRPLDVEQNIIAGVGLILIGLEKYGTDEGAACHFAHPARCEDFLWK